MFVAVIADGRVVSVESNERASLESMTAVANLRVGRPERVTRVVTNAQAFIDYSNGYELRTDLDVCDGKPVVRVVRA